MPSYGLISIKCSPIDLIWFFIIISSDLTVKLLANNLTVKSDDIIIKNQIKSIGEHLIEINPYEGIVEEFVVTVNKN